MKALRRLVDHFRKPRSVPERWWALIPNDSADEHEFHVVPLHDVVAHEFEDCVCGPLSEPVQADSGEIGWVITHWSLDGREAA